MQFITQELTYSVCQVLSIQYDQKASFQHVQIKSFKVN